eukprot:gnl/TRDRNA2_/TRDRNA2_81604_c0_seq1.p1 gnl/TRDRNA2_/TRDRNA2_81604_c0~~gnl/TRDRNA2_/TRDRNA2_81604_c0_seq1.p1  ORF type:complete len:390 (-),score=47.36 gnl/TRDRNA2_/TRDRNA2_81604_c0_seq1:316-1449(-)
MGKGPGIPPGPPPPSQLPSSRCPSTVDGWLQDARRWESKRNRKAEQEKCREECEENTLEGFLHARASMATTLDVSESPRFACGDRAMLEYLERNGYAVVRDVATAVDLEQAEGLLWKFMSENAGWSQGDPSTWTDDSLMQVGSNAVGNGIINKRGAGQSDLSWFVRTLPNVWWVFAKIWDTTDLLTSYDGFGLFRPWHHGFAKTIGGWWHVDQGRTKLGRECIQGFLSLYDQDASTGGLAVLPGSHLRFAELMENAVSDDDYFDLPMNSALRTLPQRLVTCKAGDLVLWDSRCVHCNTPAIELPTTPPDRLLRSVVYVCMTPKSWATPETLKCRQKGYCERWTTTHWPHKRVMGIGWAKAPPLDFFCADRKRRELIC